jgi:hypothetical protein
VTDLFGLLRRLNQRKPPEPDGDSIRVLLSPGAVWACPDGHLHRDEETCWCGQAMDWRET